MDILQAAKQRYTTKHYDTSKQISENDLQKLYEIVRLTPSSVNCQPWHFFIANSQERKDKILPAVLDFNASKVSESPVTLVFCIKNDIDDEYMSRILEKEKEDGRLPDEEAVKAIDEGRRYFVGLNSQTPGQQNEWSAKQLYIAIGSLLLAASAMNIDATPIEGFETEKLDEILDLKSKGYHSMVLVSLGYRDVNDSNADRPKSRLEFNEVFSHI